MSDTMLRKFLSTADKCIKIAGARDALDAKMVEQAGFDGVWASSLAISSAHGVRDAGALTMSHILPGAASMARTVSCPVIADCDAGHRSRADVVDMVRAFEGESVAGICIEDAQFPKENSLLPGAHAQVPVNEFAEMIAVAKGAQRTPDFVVIARIESLIAGAGIQDAVYRGQAYAQAGADLVVIHSKATSPDEIQEFIRVWDSQVPIVLIPTTYHSLSVSNIVETKKVKMVIYANQGMRAAISATNKVYQEILEAGSSSPVEAQIASLSSVFELQETFDVHDPIS
jgi:phosphoenolpyruvate phosphomutase